MLTAWWEFHTGQKLTVKSLANAFRRFMKCREEKKNTGTAFPLMSAKKILI